MFLQVLSLPIVSLSRSQVQGFRSHAEKSDRGTTRDLEEPMAYHGSSSAILRSL